MADESVFKDAQDPSGQMELVRSNSIHGFTLEGGEPSGETLDRAPTMHRGREDENLHILESRPSRLGDVELEGLKEEELSHREASQTCRCCAASNCCRHFERCSYAQLVQKSQSGDIILFDNPVQCNTCFISCFTRSDWDHVGMVVKKPGGSLSEAFILEAMAPQVLGVPKPGKRGNFLYSVLHWVDDPDDVKKCTHPNIMYWRPLTHDKGPKTEQFPHGKISPEMEQKIWDLACEFTGRSYERNPMEMISAGAAVDNQFWQYFCGKCCCSCAVKQYDNANTHEETLDSVFCSELVAHVYMECGIIRRKNKAHMYLPMDFSSDPHNNLQDVINPGHELLTEVRLVRDFSFEKDDGRRCGLSPFYEWKVGARVGCKMPWSDPYSLEDTAALASEKAMAIELEKKSAAEQAEKLVELITTYGKPMNADVVVLSAMKSTQALAVIAAQTDPIIVASWLKVLPKTLVNKWIADVKALWNGAEAQKVKDLVAVLGDSRSIECFELAAQLQGGAAGAVGVGEIKTHA